MGWGLKLGKRTEINIEERRAAYNLIIKVSISKKSDKEFTIY